MEDLTDSGSTTREPGTPCIQWDHKDGPLLTCSDGSLHWVTMWERLLLRANYITLESLDKKYRTDIPQKGI